MGAGFFEKARADSETWDLGLATNEGEKALIAFSASGLCSGRPTKARKLEELPLLNEDEVESLNLVVGIL
jgi:hypothetical protein